MIIRQMQYIRVINTKCKVVMLDVNERQCVNIKFDSTVPGTRAVKYLSENIEI